MSGPAEPAGYPPTAEFPTIATPRADRPRPDHPVEAPPPRRSNVPLVAVLVAVTMLLCTGTAVAGVMIVRSVINSAEQKTKEILDPITNPPELPGLPTELPGLPTDLPELPTELPQLPGIPTELPDLPTELPDLPTGLPDLPGVPGDEGG